MNRQQVLLCAGVNDVFVAYMLSGQPQCAGQTSPLLHGAAFMLSAPAMEEKCGLVWQDCGWVCRQTWCR